ncbi:MAG: site-specific integrase [Bacteroidales bacterium]|nr:site-specific integrase [Bacteroidales bacterium]
MAKAKFKLILGRRRNYPLHLELEVYKSVDCRVFISTGIVLDSDKQWDNARQMIIKNSNAEQYNKYLRQMIDRIVEVEDSCEKRGIELTPDAIKLAAKSQTAKGEDVFEVLGRYVDEEKDVRENTKRHHRNLLRMIQKFVRSYKKNRTATLFFGEVSLSLIKAMDLYFMERVVPATVSSLHAFMRKFLRRAVKEGLLGGNPYDQFEVVFYENDTRQALTSDQLSMLEEIDRSTLPEHHIREFIVDMFLFSCYTGLRYSDVSTLTRDHLHKDSHGYVLQKKTIKTGIDVTLPLYSLFNGKPQAILERYLQNEESKTVFPHIHKSAIEINLHRLEKMMNLPFPLTFHVARHTCASQLAERVDNPFVIMNVLGHGIIDTSMRYIHTSHKTAAKKLENVKWKEDLTIEEIAQSDADITQISDLIRTVCQRKELSDALTRFAIGFATFHADKGQAIAEWIGKMRKKVWTAEEFWERMEIVVG